MSSTNQPLLRSAVSYEIFDQCSEYVLDTYWKDIFQSCARNKFPRGVRYTEDPPSLVVKVPISGNRTRNEIFSLPSEPKEALSVLMTVFKDVLGLRSNKDLNLQKRELEEAARNSPVQVNCEWKKIQPRTLKDIIIMRYVLELREKHNLSSREAKGLYDLITQGFQFKRITTDDIDYENGKINNIKCLEFKPETGFTLTNDYKECSEKSRAGNNHIVPSKKFSQSIDRFIREYNSRRLKHRA